jgi:outer membrane protein TolC
MRSWLSIGLLISAMLFGGAAAVRAQTLQDALVAAYLTNPDLEAQRAALRATDELVAQALGGWRPTVAVDSAAIYNDFDSSEGAGDFNTLQSSLGLDQELYSGGGTVASTERAERLVRLERARLHAIEQDVLLDAVSAYTSLLASQAVLEDLPAKGRSARRR